jgi:hypothetical protein
MYLFIFNCGWVNTRWQQYSTHLHTNSTQNTENGTYITIKKTINFGSAGRTPSLWVIPWNLAYYWGKSPKKSVKVAEKLSVTSQITWISNITVAVSSSVGNIFEIYIRTVNATNINTSNLQYFMSKGVGSW